MKRKQKETRYTLSKLPKIEMPFPKTPEITFNV